MRFLSINDMKRTVPIFPRHQSSSHAAGQKTDTATFTGGFRSVPFRHLTTKPPSFSLLIFPPPSSPILSPSREIYCVTAWSRLASRVRRSRSWSSCIPGVIGSSPRLLRRCRQHTELASPRLRIPRRKASMVMSARYCLPILVLWCSELSRELLRWVLIVHFSRFNPSSWLQGLISAKLYRVWIGSICR